ncbi:MULTISPECIES: hypothetical protein [Mycobacterium]|uniref:hypothetical protein n=1 Tax=Mycobacterium TaxID=1763 RepID=UPI0010C387FF|nr:MULTISPECIES: hypothetical protein [Mycobacterium]APA78404.2 hypothetical protein KV38_24461 [Mycobacterium avium subsp. hominissuis]
MDLITSTEGLAAGAAAHGAHAGEVVGLAAGTAVATSAVLPGTLSPAVIEGTARVIAHGANKLAVSTAGSALLAAVSAGVAESGLAYGITEDGNAAALAI